MKRFSEDDARQIFLSLVNFESMAANFHSKG